MSFKYILQKGGTKQMGEYPLLSGNAGSKFIVHTGRQADEIKLPFPPMRIRKPMKYAWKGLKMPVVADAVLSYERHRATNHKVSLLDSDHDPFTSFNWDT